MSTNIQVHMRFALLAVGTWSWCIAAESQVPAHMQQKTGVISHGVEQHTQLQTHTNQQVKDIQSKRDVAVHARVGSSDEKVSLNFEEVDLQRLSEYMERMHGVRFIFPDTVQVDKSTKGLTNHKVTFSTSQEITKRESWDLFVRFLSLAGFDIVPGSVTNWYHIVDVNKASAEALPTYIGVDAESLPDNDMIVRYVYFLQNAQPSGITKLLTALKSKTSKIDTYEELQALIFTDKAYNIKYLMHVVREMDRRVTPQMLSVVKMKHVAAADVEALYNSLLQGSSPSGSGNNRKASSLQYFSPELVVHAEKRSNTLILMGPQEAITRFEEFITKHIDVQGPVDTDLPVHSYTLEYTKANNIQNILKEVLNNSSEAAKYGGVRDGYKYLNISAGQIVVDAYSNTLLFKCSKKEFEVIKELLHQLDIPQKQVAVEAMFIEVQSKNYKQLGMQVGGTEGKTGTFFDNVGVQTAHLGGVVTDTSAGTSIAQIKSGLASLLGSVGTAGSTILTFGQPIWAIFKILSQISSTKIIASPFGVTSNGSTLTLTSGETRRLISSEVISSNQVKSQGYENAEANLSLNVTPYINAQGMVTLDIDITNKKFAADSTNNNRTGKNITTKAVVANGEVLVLGGVMKETIASNHSGTPFLEKIPVLGWLFKNRFRSDEKDHFVVFIAPRVLEPGYDQKTIDVYTQSKIEQSQKYLEIMEDLDSAAESRDPVYRAFFGAQSPYKAEPLKQYKNRKQRAQEKLQEKKLTREDRRVIRKLKRQQKYNKKPNYSNMISEIYQQEVPREEQYDYKPPISQKVAQEAGA